MNTLMNSLMKLFAAVVLVTASLSSFAQSVDLSSLSMEDVAKIEKIVAGSSTNTSSVVRKEVGAWADLGANVGQAMVAAAREMGQAVGEFSTTPIGMITTGIVVYKLIGKDIIRFLVGIVLFVTTITISSILVFRNELTPRKYEYKPYLWGAWNRKVPVEYFERENFSELQAVGVAAFLIGMGATLLTFFA